MLRHIIKHGATAKKPIPEPIMVPEEKVVETSPKKDSGKKNKVVKENSAMEFEMIKKVAEDMQPQDTVKKVKKDKGLIERAESTKTIITEDYRQVLMD